MSKKSDISILFLSIQLIINSFNIKNLQVLALLHLNVKIHELINKVRNEKYTYYLFIKVSTKKCFECFYFSTSHTTNDIHVYTYDHLFIYLYGIAYVVINLFLDTVAYK